MRKYLVLAVLLVLTSVGLFAAEEAKDMKVPSDIGVRIRNVQLDQTRLQAQIVQLQAQYNADQQAIQHDEQELGMLKTEALATAKLDAAKYDVDTEKLIFITKPAKPEAKK